MCHCAIATILSVAMSVSVYVVMAYGMCGHEHVMVAWMGPRVYDNVCLGL